MIQFGLIVLFYSHGCIAAKGQDYPGCAVIGGNLSRLGIYGFIATPAETSANQILRRYLNAGDLGSAYAMLWEGADPATLIKRSPQIGRRLFRAQLLMEAVANDDARQTRYLIRQGLDPNYDASDGIMTPLIEAGSCASPAIVALLLNAGAQPDEGSEMTQGAWGETENLTPLLWSIDDLPVVRLLLAAGANTNEASHYIDAATNKTSYTTTPLRTDPPPAVISALLAAGADPNLADGDGQTPLMAAAADGDDPGTLLLLRAGADKVAKAHDGQTAADIAAKAGYTALARAIAAWTPKTTAAAWPTGDKPPWQ